MNLNDLTAAELASLDAICLDFERRWRAGESVSIDRIVAEHGGRHRELLRLELIAVQAELDQVKPTEQVTPPFRAPKVARDSQVSSRDTISESGDAAATIKGLPTVGALLGPYLIVGELGRGGMGVVFDAVDQRLDRRVAIKMLNDRSLRQELIDRFEREARAIATLTHPNIVELFDVGVADGLPYAVMEYLSGDTLAQRFEQADQPMSAGQTRSLGAQIADALAVAHVSGVVHRDLKPHNVMLLRQPDDSLHSNAIPPSHHPSSIRAKVFDFGLSRVPRQQEPHDSDQTRAGLILGTPGYMAPEQARGEPATAAADIFALGCILYEAFYGTRAIDGQTAADRIAATLREPSPPDPLRRRDDVALADLIQDCLQSDPGQRPAAAALSARLRGGPYADIGPEDSDIISDVGRRRFLMSVVGGVCGAVVGALSSRDPLLAVRQIQSIAVLTIEDISADAAGGMPSDGQPLGTRDMNRGQQLSALLVNELSRMNDVAVPPFRPLQADTPANFKQLGDELGVDAFLTGTVNTSTRGTKQYIELNLQLVSASEGNQLWGRKFIRESSESLLEQTKFASDIASEIGRRLTSSAEAETPFHAESFSCLLDGKARSDPDSLLGLQRALMCFKKASNYDSRVAAPLAGIALTSITLAAQSSEAETLQYVQQARVETEKALTLDKTSVDARLAQAMLNWQTLLHYDQAESDLRELTMIAPNNWQVKHQYGLLLLTLGEQQRAVIALRDASRLNPHSVLLKTDLARAEWFGGRVERAIADANRYQVQYSDHKLPIGLLIDIHEQSGRFEQAAVQQPAMRFTQLTKSEYAAARKQTLADQPYGPFGELMNQAIFEARFATIDDSRLAQMAESQSPMLPLLLAAHPAFAQARRMDRADEILPK